MPNSELTFHRLDCEADIRRWDLDAFAASFGHSVTRLFPIWVALLDSKLICYCHLHTHVVAYPAIHPDISPRQFYRLAWEWFSFLKTACGDPWVMADPASMPKATPELLSKVALEPVHDLYRIRD